MTSQRLRWAGIACGLVAALLMSPLSPVAAVQPSPHDMVVSANPADFTPHVLDGQINAFAQVGNKIIAAGVFTQVRAQGQTMRLARNNIFAFNAETGEIDTSFTAATDGEVHALAVAPDGQSVYVGGAFTFVNRTVRSPRIARVSTSTGAVVASFDSPGINGIVKDVNLQGARLYIGGTFSTVGPVTRPGLAAINSTTGAVDLSFDMPLGSPRAGGAVQAIKLDVTPDGSKLIAIGNFQTAGGQPRSQIAMVNLTTSPASLLSWSTERFAPACAAIFDTYMRDIDISPDGSYFVVVTTGAFSGGLAAGVLCDSASRWEIGPGGPNQQPTWVDYTGGDTLSAVAVTGAAVYVGGHQRWMNNPYTGDAAGPGAVARSGIAALDPLNGLPYSWNPGRDPRGVGVFAFLATSQGLWVGSDTDGLGGEFHAKLALLPLAGGAAVPTSFTGSLPGNVFLLGKPAYTVLHRVNAGGPQLPATDGGPVWAADTTAAPSPRHNSGSLTGTYTYPITRNASVPASTPTAVFSTERWDQAAAPPMMWDFPVPAGAAIQVRLYFANNYAGTALPGQRRFNVDVDGRRVLSSYDIVAEVGNRVGTMKAFDVTSDGNVDVDFGHVTENPLINAIEIVRLDAPVGSGTDEVVRRGFSSTEQVTSSATFSGGGVGWRDTRGAFMVNGTLYTGWSNGQLYARSFNGTTFGAAQQLNLNGLSAFGTELRTITGMFFANGLLYYTRYGQPRLYARYFTPESGVVGAQLFDLGGGGGIDWANVSGMFQVADKLYVGSAVDGNLRRVNWPLTSPGTASVVSGPSTGYDWRARGMFIDAHNPPPGG